VVLAETAEITAFAVFLPKALAEGVSALDIGIFVRSADQLPRAGLPQWRLD